MESPGAAEGKDASMPDKKCRCMTPPFRHEDFLVTQVGVDQTNGRFGEVSVARCKHCGQRWLHYRVEYEGFEKSGRWFRGRVTAWQARRLTPETAILRLEKMKWFFYGGSYYETDGRRSAPGMRPSPDLLG